MIYKLISCNFLMSLKEILKRINNWSLPTKIGLIFGILGLIALFFYPFFGGYSFWEKYVIEPKVEIELVYPPISEGNILVNYKNIGGKPLTNIQIEYFILSHQNYTFPIISKRAELNTYSLEKQDKGSFYIKADYFNQTYCELVTEEPKVNMYIDLKNKMCYYKLLSILPKHYCIPSKINITFMSKELPDGISLEKYYPLSLSSFELYIWGFNGQVRCLPYQNITNESNVVDQGSNQLTGWMEMNGDPIRLSKEYCQRGLMPLKWCTKNNFN